jgi:hypothetical protein
MVYGLGRRFRSSGPLAVRAVCRTHDESVVDLAGRKKGEVITSKDTASK